MSSELQTFGLDFIAAFRSGDEKAFDQVFRAYFGPLSYYAFELTGDEKMAEDIVQDCFVVLWKGRKKLEHIQFIKSYLYRCVHNHCLTIIKQRKKITTTDSIPESPEENSLISPEILANILEVISTLPSRMQQVMRLHYLEQKSLSEIGAIIGIDPETVRSHRYRAIRLIRKTISSS